MILNTKSNVMIFCCKRFKDIHIQKMVKHYRGLVNVNILGILSQKTVNLAYHVHKSGRKTSIIIIIEDLSDNDNMSRQ